MLGKPTTRGSASKSRLAHSLVAQNDAVESENKIHDDAVARKFGFAGGLVPGVTVFGYLTWPAVAEWGKAWLESGRSPPGSRRRSTTATMSRSSASGRALPAASRPAPRGASVVRRGGGACPIACRSRSPLADFPNDPIPPPDARPPAAPRSSAPSRSASSSGTGTPTHAGDYLEIVSDDLAVYRDPPVAHPGWLLRAANYVLSRSVRLGPWIHVESDCAPPQRGDRRRGRCDSGPRRRPVRAGRPPVRRARRAHLGRRSAGHIGAPHRDLRAPPGPLPAGLMIGRTMRPFNHQSQP